MNKKKLIIIGGGISGLLAARQLSAGYKITLLEALPRFGGRICTVTNAAFPITIEGGAEFIHGGAPQTIKLLNEAGITFSKVAGAHYRKNHKNVLEKDNHTDQGWELLMEKMAAVEQDITLMEFINQYFPVDKFDELRKEVIRFAQGFDLADVERVSVKALYQEWANEQEDYRVDGGYGRLIEFLTADCIKLGCTLLTGFAVKRIEWAAGAVKVFDNDEIFYQADLCLLTLSLGVLQQKHTNQFFIPAIPHYLKAIHQIGFGSVIKVILLFKQQFWKEDAGFFLSSEEIPTWWTQFPEQVPLLTGWAGGPKAMALASLSEEEITEKALLSLAAIFDIPLAEIKDKLLFAEVFNWYKEASVSGAYSFATTTTQEAFETLRQPVQNTLFFAGEGFYEGSTPGTVEAAIVSALQVAEKINRLNNY